MVGAVLALWLAHIVWKRGDGGIGAGMEAFEVEHEFAPDEAEPENPDLGEDQWMVYPAPEPMTRFPLYLPDELRRMIGDDGIVMGSLLTCSKVLVALHGRGHVFGGPVLRVFQHFVNERNVAVVMPRAPMSERQWYVLDGVNTPDQLPGWKESLELVGSVLGALAKIKRPIVVLGFSQGGAIATAATMQQPGGTVESLVLCSTYIVRKGLTRSGVLNSKSKFIFLHALRDSVVPFAWGRASALAIQAAGGDAKLVSLKNKDGHTLLTDELIDALKSVL